MMTPEVLRASGLSCFPCRPDKAPAVSKGQSWKDAALLPIEQLQPSAIWGVPVPTGTIIIDYDDYKPDVATLADFERAIGARLDWDAAVLQQTQSGGKHYAFRCDWPALNSVKTLDGFDIRSAGRGYIATGDGYASLNPFGVLLLANPAALPPLPESARELLEDKPRHQPPATSHRSTTADHEQVKQALAHLDPNCERPEWVNIGYALGDIYRDDPDTGLEVFHAWSAGEYTLTGEAPERYHGYDAVEHQWPSFLKEKEGGRGAGTLWREAINNGYRPPAGLDVSGAFGVGAAPVNVYAGLIDRINESLLNPKEMPEVIEAVVQFAGSPVQAATLRGLVLKLLKEDGQSTKGMRAVLEGSATAPKATTEATTVAELPPVVRLTDIPERQISRATGAHGSNAAIMLQEVFGGRLANFDGVLRWWTGVEWQKADEDVLCRLASAALSPDQDKMPNVKGTVQALALKAPRREPPATDHRVYFQNGVLDVQTGLIAPHHPDNNNTGALTVSYNAQAPLGEWGAHLGRVFGGLFDGEDRVTLLQEIVGWLLITDDLNVQKCVAFDGATRAGKGVIFDVLADILGKGKCGFANFANLANGKTQSLFMHHDVVFDHEGKQPPRQEIKEAIGFMNKVASNEPVSIQLLNTQTPWTGRLNSKFLFACNGIPVMVDDSGASTTRFLVLRFDRSFEGREDKGISGRMANCLEGVAAWGIAGLQRLLANGGTFTMPASSLQATDDMKDGNQPLREFIAEHCTIAPGERCHAKELWRAYHQYAADANIRASSKHAFFRSLRATLLSGPVEEKRGVRIDGEVSNGFEGISVKGGAGANSNVVVGAFRK